MTSLPPASELPRSSGRLLPIAALAFSLVGLHLLIDPSAYDVSQGIRLFGLLVFLTLAVPIVLLVRPGICRPGLLREPIVVAYAAYVLACYASLAIAINPTAGFTDCFRTLGAFFVLCLLMVLLPQDSSWKQSLLKTATVALALTGIAGIAAMRSAQADGLMTRRGMEMAFLDGPMSNVNLFASWILLLVPWCVGGTVLLVGWWRLVAATATVVGVTQVVFLQSRAAWLGLGTATIVAAMIVGWAPRSLGVSPRVRRGVQAALVVTTIAAAVVVGLAFTPTTFGEAIRSRTVARPHQAAGPSDGGRLMVWGLTVRMIEDHFWGGVGAGNFPIRLHEYLGPDEAGNIPDFSILSSDNWIQPHNDFMWVFSEKGIVGFLAFLAIFAVACRAAMSVLRRARSPTDAWLALASLCSLIAYATVSCFDFPLDRVSHQVVVAVHLATLAILSHDERGAPAARSLPGWLVAPPLVAVLALGLCYAWAAWHQERDVVIARRAQHEADWFAMRDAARRATTPWKTLDPLAVPVALLEGIAEVQLGNLQAATSCFERAYAANPNRLAVLQNLGAAYAKTGRLDEAVAAFTIAAQRYPDRLEVRHNLASALIDAGRFDDAVAVLDDVPAELRTPAMQEALRYAREQAAASEAP